MSIFDFAKANEQYIISMRREFHRHPELSGKEERTVTRICEELSKMGAAHVNVPQGGVLAFFGDEAAGPTVLLRADIDALPMQENACNSKGERAVISEVPGVMHACGHDGHTAALLGAAKVLSQHPEVNKGRIILMFERGEEATENVVYLHKYIEEHNIHIDSAWGLHLFTNFEHGKFVVYDSYALAGSLFFTVTLRGKGGHGSRPDLSFSPIDCFHAIYTGISMLKMKYSSPFKPLTLSLGCLQAGTVGNIIPGELTFKGTLRYFDREDALRLIEEFRRLLETTAPLYHCTVEHNLHAPSSGLVNNPVCAGIAREAYREAFGQDCILDAEMQMGSETFALTAALWPSAFTCLGMRSEALGTTAEHHNEYFDVAEDVLAEAAAAGLVYASAFQQSGADISAAAYPGSIGDYYRSIEHSKAGIFTK